MVFSYSPKAQKDIKKIDRTEARRILLTLKSWENGSIPLPTPKQLVGVHPPQHRFRIGNYRVRGFLKNDTFEIIRIRHRSDIYRDL